MSASGTSSRSQRRVPTLSSVSSRSSDAENSRLASVISAMRSADRSSRSWVWRWRSPARPPRRCPRRASRRRSRAARGRRSSRNRSLTAREQRDRHGRAETEALPFLALELGRARVDRARRLRPRAVLSVSIESRVRLRSAIGSVSPGNWGRRRCRRRWRGRPRDSPSSGRCRSRRRRPARACPRRRRRAPRRGRGWRRTRRLASTSRRRCVGGVADAAVERRVGDRLGRDLGETPGDVEPLELARRGGRRRPSCRSLRRA